MVFTPFWNSIVYIILLSISVDASSHLLVRQKRADECPNPQDNACLFVECENGGQCLEDPTTVLCFRCQCAPGYTGTLCDTPVAILPSGCSPGCQNGGVCNVNTCVCLAGFTGVFCETRDHCAPTNPCQNGGRCLLTGNSYICDCTGTGYAGAICATLIPTNPCSSNPCQNGGQCSWNGETMNCLCSNGYTGTFCQIAPIPCATTPCENGGKCELLSPNTYGCVCPQDFTGVRCETSIFDNHPCVTRPSSVCLNGGVCTVNGPDYLCKCATGWNGVNCQTKDTSVCDPNPCGIHGNCFSISLSTGLTAHCVCENRWTGKYCDVNMDAICPVDYCLSGGVCRINGNVPYCECPPLYTGQRCETPIVALTTTTTVVVPGVRPCSSNPCQNGGTCYSNNVVFVCACLPTWTGQMCQYVQTITTTTTTTAPNLGITCANQPCRNGGTCYATGNTYFCYCGSNNLYTGRNCENSVTNVSNCPLNCAPGYCIQSGSTKIPYACVCGNTIKPTSCV